MTNRTSWTWRHAFARSEMPATTKLVLHTIGLYMNETGGGAYPTVKQISELTSLSERAVCTHIQNAIDCGWLRSKVHGFKGQKWKNHEYEAWWPAEEGDGKGTERHSNFEPKALNVIPEGTEPNDKKALNEVQSIVPIQHSNNTVEAQAPSKRGSRLPVDWFPSQADCNLAASLGVDVDNEVDKFHDYWCAVSGAKGVKLDWNATWRNWVRNARPKQPLQKQTSTDRVLHLFAEAAKS